MTAVRVLAFIVGLALVIWPLVSAVRTVVLPRGARNYRRPRLSRMFTRDRTKVGAG